MTLTRMALCTGALILTTAGPALAQAPQSEVRDDLRPGDRVARNGLAVEVGPRGTFTDSHATTVDGVHRTLTVLTRGDGTVLVQAGPSSGGAADFAGSEPEAAAADSPAACVDGAYNLSRWSFSGTQKTFKWKSTLTWAFKANSTPSGVNVDEARTKISEATGNITASRNDCGLTDEVSATHSRAADTTAAPDFSASGELCQSYANRDNKSVVAWGTLPQGTLGAACTWGTWNGTDAHATAVESDVRLSTSYNWYGTTPPLTCVNASPVDEQVATRYWSIEGVMTHERGHSFGLGHVSEDTHGNLTMSTNLNGACADPESTLGLGDVRALRDLY